MKTKTLLGVVLAALLSLVILSAQSPAPAAWVNHNATWDAICKAQGADVAPGSPDALRWGSPAYSGTTGGQNPYGYRHLHEIMALTGEARVKAVRAIFASTMARHCGYTGAGSWVRTGGYDRAQRPIGWLPELPNDLAHGPTRWIYGGVNHDYTGLDEQHAWSFLFDVVRVGGVKVPLFPGVEGLGTVDAAVLARARLIVETAGVVGMSRQGWYQTPHPTDMNSWDRLYARLIDWPVRAYGLDCIDPKDAESALAFVRVAAQFYGMAPGCGLSDKAAGGLPEGTKYWNPAFGAWAAAALYDASLVVGMGESALGAQCRDGARRLGRWAAESLDGDVLPWIVTFNAEMVAGVSGKPVASLSPYFADGRAVRYGAGIDAGPWAFRGISAAAALGDPTAAAALPRLLSKWGAKPEHWSFLVNADWSYAVPAARAIVGE